MLVKAISLTIVNDPNEEGIVPTYIRQAHKRQIMCNSIPVKLFPANSKSVNFVNEPIAEGIAPNIYNNNLLIIKAKE